MTAKQYPNLSLSQPYNRFFTGTEAILELEAYRCQITLRFSGCFTSPDFAAHTSTEFRTTWTRVQRLVQNIVAAADSGGALGVAQTLFSTILNNVIEVQHADMPSNAIMVSGVERRALMDVAVAKLAEAEKEKKPQPEGP